MNRKAANARRAAATEQGLRAMAGNVRAAKTAALKTRQIPQTQRRTKNRSRIELRGVNVADGGETGRKKRKVTSPTLGTGGKRLWLLRSRPDQVDRPSMRGGPSRCILTSVAPHCDCCGAKKRVGPSETPVAHPSRAAQKPESAPSCNGRPRHQIASRNTRCHAQRSRQTCRAAVRMPRRMWPARRKPCLRHEYYHRRQRIGI